MVPEGFSVDMRTYACEACFRIRVRNVFVHVVEEGVVVFHDLLVDREWISQEGLILPSVGEDDGLVLAKPLDCHGNGGVRGMRGHLLSLAPVWEGCAI